MKKYLSGIVAVCFTCITLLSPLTYASNNQQVSQDLIQLLEQLETSALSTLLGTLGNNTDISQLLIQLSVLEDNELQSLINQIESSNTTSDNDNSDGPFPEGINLSLLIQNLQIIQENQLQELILALETQITSGDLSSLLQQLSFLENNELQILEQQIIQQQVNTITIDIPRQLPSTIQNTPTLPSTLDQQGVTTLLQTLFGTTNTQVIGPITSQLLGSNLQIDTSTLLQTLQQQLREDTDDDGVSDLYENTSPNSGDSNFDGVPDSQQQNVAFIPTSEGNESLTLSTFDTQCNTINDLDGTTEDSIGTQDAGFEYPYGLNRFILECDIATIRIYYHGISNLENYQYRKRSERTQSYIILPVTYGEQNETEYIEFTIEDGSVYDDSPAGDGFIIDDNGLALPVTNNSGRSSSVQYPSKNSSSVTSSDETSDSPSIVSDGVNTATSDTNSEVRESTPVSIQDANGSLTLASLYSSRYDMISSLPMRLKYRNDPMYIGKTLVFFKKLIEQLDTVSPTLQETVMQLVVQKVEGYTNQVLEKYNINKEYLLLLLNT